MLWVPATGPMADYVQGHFVGATLGLGEPPGRHKCRHAFGCALKDRLDKRRRVFPCGRAARLDGELVLDECGAATHSGRFKPRKVQVLEIWMDTRRGGAGP